MYKINNLYVNNDPITQVVLNVWDRLPKQPSVSLLLGGALPCWCHAPSQLLVLKVA
jgi:hypothetical protein